MPTILLTNNYKYKALSVLKNEIPNSFELITLDEANKEELVNKAKFADYFLVSGRLQIDNEVINAAVNLKMIQRTGVGLDTLDFDTLKNKNIPVYVNPGINSRSVAEHTMMLILSVLRRLTQANNNLRKGSWIRRNHGLKCNELYNKTVGLIGLGNIGKKVAYMLSAFGAKVLYYKPTKLEYHKERDINATYRPLNKLLKKVDILSLHCPLTNQTREMIGRKEMSLMKTGSIIINTSRGKLIDQNALIDFLEEGHLRGLGLDVFYEEPLPENSPLLHYENVILTPHVGGITYESFRKLMRKSLNNIKMFDQGKLDLIEDKKVLN